MTLVIYSFLFSNRIENKAWETFIMFPMFCLLPTEVKKQQHSANHQENISKYDHAYDQEIKTQTMTMVVYRFSCFRLSAKKGKQ